LENRSKDISIQVEKELNEDDKRPTILKSEVVKGIKDMQRKKATGDDNILVDLLKELGDSGFKIITELFNKIYMSGDWPKEFLDVTTIALPKKNKVKKCNDHTTIQKYSYLPQVHGPANSMAYGTRRFNAAFTRAL
jgi:hypothetical protein